MPIDPRIPLGGGQSVQQQDPMQTLAQVAALQNMALQRQEAQQRIGISEQNLQIQQAEEARKKQIAEQVQAATGRVAPLMGLTAITPDQITEALTGAAPEVQMAARTLLQKHQDLVTEGGKKKADLDKTSEEIANLRRKRRANLGRGVRQFGYDTNVAQLAFGLEAEDDPEEVGRYWQVAQQSPDHLKKIVDFFIEQDPENKDLALMAVSPGETVINPNVPTPTALYTGPAKPEEPAKAGTLEAYILSKFGAQPTAAQQRQGKSEWEAAGRAGPEPPKVGTEADFITRLFGRNPTPEQVQEGLRRHGEAQRGIHNFDPASFPPGFTPAISNAYATALSRATSGGNITQQKRNAWNIEANELAKRGDTKQLGEVIGQAAIESENVDQRNLIRGRVGMRISLGEMKQTIQEMEKAGVPTSKLTGSAENIAQWASGQTTNPKLAQLGARMKANLVNYRRATTGVQFGEKEAEAYEANFPSSVKGTALNVAIIDGLLEQVKSDDAVYWHGKVGPDGMRLIQNSIRPETIGWGTEAPGEVAAPEAEGTVKPIPGVLGGEATMRGGRWIRTK